MRTLTLALLLAAPLAAQKHPAPHPHAATVRPWRGFVTNNRFRPSNLFGNALGQALGGMIEEGTRGIDAMFDDGPATAPGQVTVTTTADAWHAQVERENAMRAAAPPPPPQIAPWEVLSSEGRLADSNGSVGHYAWRIVVRNNTDADLTLSGDVELVDADGHAVDSVRVVGLRIAAHADQEMAGSKMVMADAAIVGVKAVVK